VAGVSDRTWPVQQAEAEADFSAVVPFLCHFLFAQKESGEKIGEATVAKYATVQKEGDREIERKIQYLFTFYTMMSKTKTVSGCYFINKLNFI
jgi:hypothetical protein